ncbi:phospholipase-like protein [Tanacetum coccineum]
MKDKLEFKGISLVGAFMNAPIFVGTFSVVTDFAVIEDMDHYRDEEMDDVIVGKEFCKEIRLKVKQFEGMITIYNDNDEMTYQMARSHPRFKHLTNEQCNKIPPLLKVNEHDKRNGISHSYQKLKEFNKGVLNLGPDIIRDPLMEELLTRGHVGVHGMEWTSKIQGISFITEEEEEDSSETLPCQLPPKEINLGSFTLPCTIGSLKLYDMADLGAGVNVMPKSLFEHLELADLKETNMVVEMADIKKKAPLGIVENILLKIDKFLFYSDFVVIDMLEGLNETMLLGRPFLATIHAQIDVFRKEISLGIGEEKVKFDINGEICHSRVPVEKIYMASFVQESKKFNPFEIENDVLSYDSPACLLLEQGTPSCSKESIDTVDSSHDMQEVKGSQDDEVGSHLLENIVSRWHVYKPVEESGMLKQWICFQDHERQNVGGNGMIFADFLKVRYGNKNIDDITHERRYYEWVAQYYDFNVKSQRATEDNSFEEWVKIKLGHTNVSETIKYEIFKEWIKENFDFELENEYELKAGRKRYGLDKVWEKCEKFHDTTKLWYDKGFEEEELWQNGIEDIDYTPPLEEEKSRRRAMVYNDAFTSEVTLSCEPTVSPLNDNKIDFRISFDESDDEDYTVIYDKNSFSYKIIYVDDLKTDSKNDNDKVNMPSFPSPEPTVSYFDDLDFFKDFEKEFSAIVYNDALTSKSDFLTEPTMCPQHINEFNLKDETSLSKCDEEKQNVLYFNDLFPFNVIYPDYSKSDKDNADDKIDIK